MIAHLVLLKPRPDLSRSDRDGLASAFEHAVRTIPTVREVRVGRRVMHGAGYEQAMPDAADFVAMLQFDDLAGLQTYLAHPAHAELGARFGASLASSLVFDFEVGDLSILAALLRATTF